MVTKSKKNTVSIYTQDGMLRLNFRVSGKRYRFALGYPDEPTYRVKAESIARMIELDILSGHFDPTLTRYRDKPIPTPVENSNAVPIKPKKRYNSRNPKRKPFSKAEVQRILDALYNDTHCSKFSRVKHSHYAPYYECLLLTACRPAEIIGLRWSDVREGYIEISSALDLNLQIPVILIALNNNCTQAFWVLFDIEKTTGSKSGWWIEIPKKNRLDSNVKDIFSRTAGESQDYSEEIQNLWAMNKALSETSLLAFAVTKSEVRIGSLSTLNSMLRQLTKNKEMMINKRASAEIFFPEYDSDPREIYQIPEIRRWFQKTIDEGFPWFYFLSQDKGISLTALYCCTCKVSFQGIHDNKHGLEIYPDETEWWLTQNFMNLNNFIEANGIPEKINKEISKGIENWFKRFSSGNAIDFIRS
jgi:hypothetical protein